MIVGDPPSEADLGPPAWLPRRGKGLWRQLAPVLVEPGVLGVTDLAAFAIGCASYGAWHDARETIRAEGA